MSTEREASLYLAQILFQSKQFPELVVLMKKVVEMNPELNIDERAILSSSYKGQITQFRDGISHIMNLIETENSSNRLQILENMKKELLLDLERVCLDLIGLVDDKLLPATKDTESIFFYMNLKADYYRYLSETSNGDISDKYSPQAKDLYEKCIEFGKKEIPSFNPASMALYLNYTVFLNDVLKDQSNAVSIAKKVIQENIPLIDQNSAESFDKSRQIIGRMQENIKFWTNEE